MSGANILELVGPPDLFKEAPFMGKYIEKPGMGRRKLYTHEDGKFKLFYCSPKCQWIVGVDVRSGEGWLFIESEGITPDKALGGWSFWDSRKNDWVKEPELRVVKPGEARSILSQLANLNLSDPQSSSLKPPKQTHRSGHKLSIDDFQTIRVIGRGSFGEVRVAVKKGTEDVYAIKRLKKRDMVERKQVDHIWGERRFLAGIDNPWVVRMFHTFQDKRNLYFVLEYCPGGDFLRLLIQKDRFNCRDTAFYIAQIACGLKSVHDQGYIHRDIKPDNILISATGHLKLTDFGLCKQLAQDADRKLWKDLERKEAQGKVKNGRRQQSCVGTPDYVAPEVLRRRYGRECDWWSVGVILYECIVGYPPFMSDSLNTTAKKILDHHKTLKLNNTYLKGQTIAKDLITKLICDVEKRINFEGLVNHKFFEHINWKKLDKMEPPFIPEVAGKVDTQNFDKFEDKSVRGRSVRGDTARLNFPQFTWDRRPTPSDRDNVFTYFGEENAENKPPSVAASDERK